MSDKELVDATREGHRAAYAVLWTRHFQGALRAAHQFDHSSEAEDIVASAFTRIFKKLKEGYGPEGPFRPYLTRAVLNLAQNSANQRRKVVLTADETVLVNTAGGNADPLDRGYAAEAFRRLPRVQRELLWHSEIEGMSNGEIACLSGTTAGGVKVALFRARRSLRQAFVQAHVSCGPAPQSCCRTLGRAGRYVYGSLPDKQRRDIELHLSRCDDCAGVVDDLRELSSSLP